jgi:hypothetical protein
MTPKATRPPQPQTPKTPKAHSFGFGSSSASAGEIDVMGTSSTESGGGFSTPTKKSATKAKRRFAFDQIFSRDTTQREIFKSVEPYIEAAVDGYNATLFCYG